MDIQKMNEELMVKMKDRLLSGHLSPEEEEHTFKMYVLVGNLHVDQEKVEVAAEENEIRKAENDFKKRQQRDQQIEMYIRIGADLVKLSIPLIFYAGLNKTWLLFEQKDIVSSQTVRNGVTMLREIFPFFKGK